MDAEEIAKLVEGLRVSAEARERVVMISGEEAARGQKRIEKIVVGKIFTKRSVNRETLRSNLPRILRSRGTTEIKMVGHNWFVISFSLERDKKVALDEGPWHFFQDLMVLKQTEAMQTPSEVEFNEISLWIQCHNVPFECMEPEIITRIGNRIGKVGEVDVKEGGLCLGKFARVRVTRRIDEPLLRCVPLVHEVLQKEVLVLLQYERLSEFCFICGRVGHISKDCVEERRGRGEFHYDSWLRAGRSFLGTRSLDRESGGSQRLGLERGRVRLEASGEREDRYKEPCKEHDTLGLVDQCQREAGKKGEGGEGDEREEGERSGVRGRSGENLEGAEEEAMAVEEGEEDMSIQASDQVISPGLVEEDTELAASSHERRLNKEGGRGWKRRARIKKGKGVGEEVAEEKGEGRGVGVKRRRTMLQKGGGEEG